MKFQSARGVRDILEGEWAYFETIKKSFQKIAEFYDFSRIEIPIIEPLELFKKGTGENTEIVEKQMYKLRTKGGDWVVLRPEGTPSVVRAYMERGMQEMPKPVKLWYFGPFFRYERPQFGRFRQFYSFGLESIGSPSWITDAQIILISYKALVSAGVKDLVVEINSLGDEHCRPYYEKALLLFLRQKRNSFCADCKERIRGNPLRVLDCKNEICQSVIRSGAPQILDYLCKKCSEHFKLVLETLDELTIPYELNPYLVRGLDYYTKTVFEITQRSEEEKIALGGGGRYDNLVSLLGGKEAPACGFGCGVDRVAEILKKTKKIPNKKQPAVFLAQVGDLPKRKSLWIAEELRKKNIKVAEGLHKESLSLQLKLADEKGVSYTLILGQKEALAEKIILRNMKTGSQRTILIEDIAEEVKKKIKG